jgi:hypothetical protein
MKIGIVLIQQVKQVGRGTSGHSNDEYSFYMIELSVIKKDDIVEQHKHPVDHQV